jgi:4-diphosphocytidyl-2-C-methyl-D-erythritol kinase
LPGVDYDPQTLVAADGTEVVLVNDLERPVFAKHLLLPDLKMWLRARPEVSAALMSGSGSTLFAVLREDGPATVLREDLAREYGPHLWTWQGLAG